MDPKPGPSYLAKKELAQARLSLIENEEEPSIEETLVPPQGGKKQAEVKAGFNASDLIWPGWERPVYPPPPSLSDEPCNLFLAIWNTIVYLVLTLVFCIVFPFLFVFVFIPAVLQRFSVRIILKCFYGHKVQMLPMSRISGAVDINYNTVVLVCRGRCDIERIREHMVAIIGATDPVRNGASRFAHLQRKVSSYIGYLCLENYSTRFDIKNHVKHFDIRSKNLTVSSDDVINYLESTIADPFENSLTQPQWEILVIPKFAHRSTDLKLLPETEKQRRLYALVFRFHNGIMDWNMFQTLLVEFIGKTGGRVKSVFCPSDEKGNLCAKIWRKLKILLLVPFVGPHDFLLKVLTRWSRFGGMTKSIPNKTSLAMTRPIDCETIEDIKDRTYSTSNSILAQCVRISIRNMILGQGKAFPKKIKVTRVFNTCTESSPGIDGYTANYREMRQTPERLHASYHVGGKTRLRYEAKKMFNKGMIWFAGAFVDSVAGWVLRNILKSDVVVEIWPCSDEPCKIFGGDIVADIFGWSGSIGIDADFKMTVTSYCGRVRANVTGKLGVLPGECTDAFHIAREFEEEYKLLAAVAGVYPNRLFLPPAVDESSAMYL